MSKERRITAMHTSPYSKAMHIEDHHPRFVDEDHWNESSTEREAIGKAQVGHDIGADLRGPLADVAGPHPEKARRWGPTRDEGRCMFA